VPEPFTSWSDFEHYVQSLISAGIIDNGKKIWWDLRPHPIFPTIEFRICDATTRVEESVCMAGLIQAICAKLIRLRERNQGFRKYLPNLVNENKWRAISYGIEGKLIDFGKQTEVPMRDLALELLEFVDDVTDELGSRSAVEYVHTILRDGTSADRQLRVYKETGHLHAVVDQVAAETVAALPVESRG
jgi:carboxylate-amine ligase